MFDREQIIKSLECCSFAWNIDEPPDCRNCPYADEKFGTCQVPDTTLIDDTIELLKADQHELIHQRDTIAQLQAALDLANSKLIKMGYEAYNCDDGRGVLENIIKVVQEPRVLTLNEVETGEHSMYLEVRDEVGLNPFPVLLCVNGLSLIRLTNADGARFGFEKATYNKTWRCWSSKPTDEQRKVVKWNECSSL